MLVLLEVRGLTKRFGGLTAVSNINFAITEGQIFGVIGPNGAGKTTLFNIIAGTFPPSAGQVYFAGEAITASAPHSVCRRGLARTFQIVRPFGSLSVIDNVVIGAFAKINDREQALELATNVIAQMGLARWSDAPARSLPIGLRKRVEVARALATQPKIILLDEVMNGLNPTELAEMMGLLRQLNESGVSILLIEHVMAAVMSLCSCIAVVHHGEKIAEGPPDKIARDPSVIEAYLGEEFLIR